MTAASTIFDKFYDAGEEALKILSKPFVKKRIARKFEAALDNAEMRLLETEDKIRKHYELFTTPDSFDVNVLVKLESELQAYTDTIKFLKKQQDKIFK